MGDVFYIGGLGLVVVALVLSFVGLRSDRFPASRAAHAGVLAVIGALVVATCAFAIVLAQEEQEHREEEKAQAAEGAEEDAAPAEEPGAVAPPADDQVEQEPATAAVVEVSSPADGALVFDPDTLEGEAGPIELAYTNPSPVPHNIAVEVDGETLAESETVTDGDAASATAELEPGEYVFYCAIPGHRESGMEGTLTLE